MTIIENIKIELENQFFQSLAMLEISAGRYFSMDLHHYINCKNSLVSKKEQMNKFLDSLKGEK